MAGTVNIEDRTKEFIVLYNKAKEIGLFKTDKELAETLGITTAQTITEIKKLRQNIPAHVLSKFKKLYNTENTEIVKLNVTDITRNYGKSIRKNHDTGEAGHGYPALEN